MQGEGADYVIVGGGSAGCARARPDTRRATSNGSRRFAIRRVGACGWAATQLRWLNAPQSALNKGPQGVDAPIMPAPTHTVGERGADLILGDARMPA
jgi:hypothetical protein